MITLEQIKRVYAQRTPEPIGKHKFFSVLVPFVEVDGKLHLLYEVRAKDMVSQPGEICFPGGHIEKNESPEACALRETEEEIGIPIENIQLIGEGDTLYGYANYTLFTFVGIIQYEDYRKVKLAADEVDEVFLVPIDELITHPPEICSEKISASIGQDFPYDRIGIDKSYPWRVGEWVIPIYDIQGKTIWGLTARITQNVISHVN